MAKEIIGFINKNNDIFNLKDNSSASYCCKVGQGHENKIAVFTEDGNLKDGGKTIDDLVTKVQPSANGNLASLDENGNLVDSGKKTGDFVPYVSEGTLGIKAEEYISLLSGDVDHQYVNIEIDGNGEQENPKITINIEVPDAYPSISKSATIDTNNIDNLNRALKNPSITPENDNTKLITSGAVYQAIKDKFSLVKSSDNEIVSLAVDVDEEGGTIELYTTDGNGVAHKSTIDSSNIENLNRALKKPDTTPIYDSDNLITSNAVYGALSGKASSSSVNSLSARIGLLESYLLTNKCTIQVDITRGYDGTNYYYIIKNGDNNVVSASTAEYVTLQNIDDIFRLAKTGDTIGITTINGNVILSGTISEKSLGAIKVSSAFDDQYVETFLPGTGTLTLSVSTQS